jgi:hypothetical protein
LTTETENVPSPILTNAAKMILQASLLELQERVSGMNEVVASDEHYRYAMAFGMSQATLASMRLGIIHALKLLGTDLPWPNETI